MMQKKNLIDYRIQKAIQTLEEAKLLLDAGRYNASINRSYYACFYSVLTLLATKDLGASKHKGVRLLLNKEFVKNDFIDKEWYKFYATLSDYRHESDYKDYKEFSEDDAYKLFSKSEGFINMVKEKIKVLL